MLNIELAVIIVFKFFNKGFSSCASKKFYNNNAVILINMENYVKYSLTGKPIKIKKGVFPHFFDCQKHRSNKKTPTPRPAFV